MRAMILAAGLGTRLYPLTNDTPKALIQLAGRPLLDIVLTQLIKHGFNEIAINIHHHADQVRDYLKKRDRGDTIIHCSFEESILGTGGGIKKMVPLLGTDEPILVYNVDVLTNLDLSALYQRHLRSGVSATLAVQSRETKRYLLFDENGLLCGRVTAERPEPHFVRKPEGGISFRAFNGIHVIEPTQYLDNSEKQFSSIDFYLQLAASEKKILEYRMDQIYWRDLGRLQNLQDAEKDIKEGHIVVD